MAPGKKRWIRPVVILAIIAVVGALVWFSNRNQVQNADVGDCVSIDFSKGTDSASAYSIVGCEEPDAHYQVISVEDGSVAACMSPDVDYQVYRTDSSGDDAKSWCMKVNARVGDCYSTDSKYLDCAEATSADLEVVAVLTATQDKGACPTDAEYAKAYAYDNTVTCMKDPS